MEVIKWTEKFSVGNSIIDTQHKRLVTLINQLHIAMREGKGKQVLQKILDDLVLYTLEHFRTEEDMMRRSNYLKLKEHKDEHEALAKKAIALQSAYIAGQSPLTLDVMNFLRDWLVNHIEGSDMEYKGKLQ